MQVEDIRDEVRRQYAATDPLNVRIETHQRYSERQVDLDVEAARLMHLAGGETVVDVGCGPGRFPCFLRANGHQGTLVGLEQSRAMLAEGRSTAREGGLLIAWVAGDAAAVPLADGSVDWVVARHMLYHVPDIPRALAEFQRVLRPRGRILLSTNSGDSLPRIRGLERDLAATFGLPDIDRTDAPFCMENALRILAAAGLRVTAHVIRNALVFTAPEPIVAYIASVVPAHPTPAEAALRDEMLDWLTAEATRRSKALGGVWRDPKDVGLYVCVMRDASVVRSPLASRITHHALRSANNGPTAYSTAINANSTKLAVTLMKASPKSSR